MCVRLHSEITVRAANLQTLGFYDLKVISQQQMHLPAIATEFAPVISAQGTNTNHPYFHVVILVVLRPQKKRPIQGAVKIRTFPLDSDGFLSSLKEGEF